MNNKTGNQNARKYPISWISTFIREYGKGKTIEQIADDSGIHIRTLDLWKRQYITCIDSHIKKGLKNKFIRNYIETGGNYSETAKRTGITRQKAKEMKLMYLNDIHSKQALFNKLSLVGIFSVNQIAFFLSITPMEVKKLKANRDRLIRSVSSALNQQKKQPPQC